MTTEYQREQQERRETLENDRRVREQGTTYSSFAEAFADEERGGRFRAVNQTTVVGATPAPVYPQGPAWSAADQVPEPSLGYAIDDAPVVGEAHELAASLEALGEAALHDGPPEGGEARSGTVEPLAAVEQRSPLTNTDDDKVNK